MFGKFATFVNLILAGILLLSAAACSSQAQTPPGLASATQTPQPPPDPDSAAQFLLGRWSGVDKNNEVIMLFQGDGTIGFAYLGALHAGTYKLNAETTPMQLDLMFDDQPATIYTILEFINADTIRFNNNIPGAERVTTFSDPVTLYRVKE